MQAEPRMSAAFRLHSAATTFADYALCMVGPTGPSLLRDNPAEFKKLARRRLVGSSADDHPFARCAHAAGEVMESVEVERAHRATAASFVEYGADTPPGDALRLDALAVTTARLAELTDKAWPFVRGGYTALVKASAYAPEAAHPAELPRPGKGRGTVGASSLAHCTAADGVSYALVLSPDHKTKLLRSRTADGVETDAAFAPAEARVFAVSCDTRGAVVAAGREGTRDVALFSCGYLGECRQMPLPRLGGALLPRYPLDVARVDGVVVVAVPMHGIVRVASSRDDGRSWTPFTVAYDPEAHPELRFDVKTADHLRVVNRRLLLSGNGRSNETYPVLASDDAGASWRAP
jgi:hypothetical protein